MTDDPPITAILDAEAAALVPSGTQHPVKMDFPNGSSFFLRIRTRRWLKDGSLKLWLKPWLVK